MGKQRQVRKVVRARRAAGGETPLEANLHKRSKAIKTPSAVVADAAAVEPRGASPASNDVAVSVTGPMSAAAVRADATILALGAWIKRHALGFVGITAALVLAVGIAAGVGTFAYRHHVRLADAGLPQAATTPPAMPTATLTPPPSPATLTPPIEAPAAAFAAAPAAAAPPAAAPGPAGVGTVIETRLAVIAGWTLLDVLPKNHARVRGRDEILEIQRGSRLPGAGTVEEVRREGGRWVVVTTQGVIAPRD
jgi:hypothetical protein